MIMQFRSRKLQPAPNAPLSGSPTLQRRSGWFVAIPVDGRVIASFIREWKSILDAATTVPEDDQDLIVLDGMTWVTPDEVSSRAG